MPARRRRRRQRGRLEASAAAASRCDRSPGASVRSSATLSARQRSPRGCRRVPPAPRHPACPPGSSIDSGEETEHARRQQRSREVGLAAPPLAAAPPPPPFCTLGPPPCSHCVEARLKAGRFPLSLLVLSVGSLDTRKHAPPGRACFGTAAAFTSLHTPCAPRRLAMVGNGGC